MGDLTDLDEEQMSKFVEWFARNRGSIGLGLLAAIAVAQASPVVQAHPYWSLGFAAVAAYIRASGAHYSDKYQRDQQASIK